jgi:NAD(P)-dependent dehydrogenase (short-subunit alcohol dehydrogenase family)
MNYGRADGSTYPALFFEQRMAAEVVLTLLRIESRLDLPMPSGSESAARLMTEQGWSLLLADMERDYEARANVESLLQWILDDSDWDESALDTVRASFVAAAFALLESCDLTGDLWDIRTLVDCIEAAQDGTDHINPSVLSDAISASVTSILRIDDRDQIAEQLDVLASLAERFALKLDYEEGRLRDHMEELRGWEDLKEASDTASAYASEDPDETFDMDHLFAGLRERGVEGL